MILIENRFLVQMSQGSPWQDPAGDWTIRRPPDHCKETQTAVVWSCLPFIMSGQNHLARHSEMGKKTRQAEEELGRQHQGMDRPGVRQVPEGSGEKRTWRKLVAKSSVVPQRPVWLRGRWKWSWRTLEVHSKCTLKRHHTQLQQNDATEIVTPVLVFSATPYAAVQP